MAELHNEDSPLLESGNVLTHGVPIDVRIIAVTTGTTTLSSQNDHSDFFNPVLSTPILETRVCSATVDNLDENNEDLSVFAQTYPNTESGCDCVAPEIDPSSHHLLNHSYCRGFSTVYPKITMQPLSTVYATEFVAPLAKNESLDCHCDGTDQRCNCRISSSLQTCHDSVLQQSEIPKVTFHIEGFDDELPPNHSLLTDLSDAANQASCSGSFYINDEKKCPHLSSSNMLRKIPSYSKPGMLSASSSTASMPMCRICHFPQGEIPDTLISPCRCSGTMQFIHESCLMKWIDVSKSKKGAACELCNYQYHRHKKFRLRHWELPSCSRLDKCLHLIFILCLVVMATCATITVYCFKQDRFIKKKQDVELTKSEIITLTCGVLFFVAFFMAMYVEVKAKDTLYRLFSRFVRLNQTWHIDDYNKQEDNQNVAV